MLLIDGGGSMRRALIDSGSPPRRRKMNGKGSSATVASVRSISWKISTSAFQALAAIPVGADSRISKPICRSTSAASPSCRMTTSMPIPQGDPLPDALDIE